MGEALRRLNRCFCRHEFVRRFGPYRLWLECTSCGYETAGVTVTRGAWPSRARPASVTAPLGALVESVRAT